MAEMQEGDAVVVIGSGFGVIVKLQSETTRMRFLTGTEEDLDPRYVSPAAPSLVEQIKARVKLAESEAQ